MRIDVYLPLLLALLLAAVSPAFGRRLAPGYAVRVLVITGLVTSAASVWAMLLLAGTLIDETPPVAASARQQGISVPDPVPEIIAMTAIAALGLGALRVWRVVRAHRAARRAVRRLRAAHAADSELIVADSTTPQAFTLPGNPGRILVSSAMLNGLAARERHVLLAHERTHLRYGHHRLRLLADLAAAANVLLVPLRDTVAYLLERWADEDAAQQVADRPATARAVARAALLSRRSTAAAGCTLAFSELAVSRRVAALRSPPPRARPWALGALGLAALPAGAAADATGDFFGLIGRLLVPVL